MKKILLVLFSVLLLITSGCGQNTDTAKENSAAAYVVTDDKGRQVKIAGKPVRIVSATYGTDEILAEIVTLDRVKAFSKWAGDPEITFITKEQAERVGNKVGENTEAIVALKPDLVFVSTATPDSLVKNLEDMEIPVYVAGSPKTIEAMRKKVLGVAAAAGEKSKGEALVNTMDNKLAELESKLKVIPKDKEKVVMAFSFIGAIGRKDNLLDDIFCMLMFGMVRRKLDLTREAMHYPRNVSLRLILMYFYCRHGILTQIMMCKNMHSRWLLILPLRTSKR